MVFPPEQVLTSGSAPPTHTHTGDYVLRDAAGSPRGMVRVMMRWKYPFQPSVSLEKEDGVREDWRRERGEASLQPVAKPRVKVLKASKR